MFIDNSLILGDNMSLTVSGPSVNYIDALGAGAGEAAISGVNNISGGGDAYKNCWFEVLIRTTVTGCTSIAFDLRTDTVSTFPTDTVLYSTGAIPVASLVAKYVAAKVRIPQGIQRYLRGYITIVGTATAGAWDMKIIEDVDINLT